MNSVCALCPCARCRHRTQQWTPSHQVTHSIERRILFSSPCRNIPIIYVCLCVCVCPSHRIGNEKEQKGEMSQRCGSMAPSVRPKIKHARWLIVQGALFRVCPCPFPLSFHTTVILHLYHWSILCFFYYYSQYRRVFEQKKKGWTWQWYKYVTRKRERICKMKKKRD